MDELKGPRMLAALEKARATGDLADLIEQLMRGSGLPGPRPNLDLAQAVGRALAEGEGRVADQVVAELGRAEKEYLRVVAAFALVARSLKGEGGGRGGRRGAPRSAEALEALQELAEDPRHLVRLGVVEALRSRIAAVGAGAVEELAAWTDGYLQAHVALEALADRALLDRIPTGEGVLARLEEAFVLADASPRSAERLQGMRQLRQGMPAQIVAFAARFPETLAWLSEKAACTRPETREVVAGAIKGLRRSVLSDVEAGRLSGLLEASAKPPRDPSRVVQGTRKRGRGRR